MTPMKYLKDYTEAAMSAAYAKAGAFYAFSDAQFDESADPNRDKADYTHVFGGLICPTENVKTLLTELEGAITAGIALDMAENGKVAIIKRELANYESYYTGEITPAVENLERYDITREEIMAIFREERANQDE